MMDYSGRALIGAEIGAVLGVTDIDGTHPLSQERGSKSVPVESATHRSAGLKRLGEEQLSPSSS
jgi:hypothetical protein